MTTLPPVRATVVIVSKNRRDELRTAVRSALAQTGVHEVLVIDDGSTDGTAEMIQAEFAGVRLVRHARSRGYIARRNEGLRDATGEVVVSIDDDAAFTTPSIIGQTLARFDQEMIGAVAIPYADVVRSPTVRQLAPDATSTFVTATFIGTAHALRRDVFEKVGAYREHLVHQGEESDLCIRMLAAGYVVRLGSGDPIHHFESPKRSFTRMDHFGPRNALLFGWQNVPFPSVLLYLPVTVWRVMFLTMSPTRFLTRLGGLISGCAGCFRCPREPVSSRVYAVWRRLRRSGAPLTLEAVTRALGTHTR
jgi:glycosyltransferase involved in cell wall biosynthesis